MRARKWVVASLGILSLGLSHTVLGSPAYPFTFALLQPDGSTIVVRAVGDEFSHALETLTGFTVLRDPDSNAWVYAAPGAGGGLRPSALRVGRDAPIGLAPHLRNPSRIRPARPSGGPTALFPLPEWWYREGELPVLVILVEFRDQKLVGSNARDWNKIFFGARGSVAHWFREVSRNRLRPVPAPETQGTARDGVVTVSLPDLHPWADDAEGHEAERRIVKKAIEAADRWVDFAALDRHYPASQQMDEYSIVLIFAGYEGAFGADAARTPNVWAHAWGFDTDAPVADGVRIAEIGQWGGYAVAGEWHGREAATQLASADDHRATIGTSVHEMGHSWAALPDLYDTDGTSQGVGYWCVMGAGSWLGPEQARGSVPAHMSAWPKYWLGWTRPTVISRSAKIKIPQAETTGTTFMWGEDPAGPERGGGSGEYFLVENRQRVGFDKYLPGEGLAVWHVEESMPNNRLEGHTAIAHRFVDLEEADGLEDLDLPSKDGGNRGDAGDLFPGSTVNRNLLPDTSPHCRWYDGSDSGVGLTGISASRKTMTARTRVR